MLGNLKNKNIALLLISSSLLLTLSACRYCEAGWHYYHLKSSMRSSRIVDGARLDIRENIPILHLYGTPEEMGRQYGEILKDPLQRLFKCVRLFIDEEYSKELIEQAEMIEMNLPESIRLELKAISQAAEIPYMDLVAVNVTPRLMCSALAVWGEASENGEMLMGRNSDYPSFHLEKVLGLIVVYHPDDMEELVSINFLGMIGAFTGINSKGVSFGNMLVFNAEMDDDEIDLEGLPIQLLMRIAAHDSVNAREFLDFLDTSRHLIPMNVMVADPKQAILAEITNIETVIRTGKKESYLASSNSFLAKELYNYPEKCDRYDSLVDNTKQNFGKFNVETMKKALYDARMEGINVQAVIFQPSKMKIHVSINREPASEGPYLSFDIKTLINKKTSD